jgi:hypothetical protein
MHKFADVIYKIKAEVQDYEGLKSEKWLNLNITTNQTWYDT